MTTDELCLGLVETARKMLGSRWLHVWAPGGQIVVQAGRRDGRVFAGDLVVETEGTTFQFWSVSEGAGGAEDFYLVLEAGVAIGTPESERRFRPPRRPVDHFPSDLNLAYFVGREPHSALLLHDSNAGGPTGIVFELAGQQLIFWTDDVLPSSVACSSEPAVVREVVERYTGIRITKEGSGGVA